MSSESKSTPGKAAKHGRVLACLPCRQKKLRCDHGSPCTNCVKSDLTCTPGSMAQHPRKRRFPERELLDRIRKYERLLHDSRIPFEPMHSSSSERTMGVRTEDERRDPPPGDVELQEASTPSSARFQPKNAWHMMSQGFREADNDSDSSQDNVRQDAIKNEWEKFVEDSDHLLFSLPRGTIDLTTIHPTPVQIFKLWQVYLDNVNPLLKVTHIPSLQGRIVEAASDASGIAPTLEALMFGIYCVAVLSLTDDQCYSILGSAKRDRLTTLQLGCQQALWNCTFLRSDSRDCLTAFLLYLVSVRPNTAPQSLSCMLGVAIRTAKRMGIHNETMLAKISPFEAEMSRRLWWALVLFDSRMGAIAGSKSDTLDPTWDCAIPLNVNDSELWPQMKEPPSKERVAGKPSEAVFAIVRSELGDFTRHSTLHLDLTNPALKSLLKADATGWSGVEKAIEQRYLQHCDMDNPLHAMTTWTARAYLAKHLLLECQSQHANPESFTPEERDIETTHAIRILEQDSNIMTSSLTAAFTWLNHAYFPFPAYMQIAQDLRKRPGQPQAARAWDAMNRNFGAWSSQFRGSGPFFRIFSKLVLEAYDAIGSAEGDVPSIVRTIRELQAQSTAQLSENDAKQQKAWADRTHGQFSEGFEMPYSGEMRNEYATMQPEIFPAAFEQNLYMDWSALGSWPGWSAS